MSQYTLRTFVEMPYIIDVPNHTDWSQSVDAKGDAFTVMHHQAEQITKHPDIHLSLDVLPDNRMRESAGDVEDGLSKIRLAFRCNYPGNQALYVARAPIAVRRTDFLADIEQIRLWEKLHPASRIQISGAISELIAEELGMGLRIWNETYHSRNDETPVELFIVPGSSKLHGISEHDWCNACDILTKRMKSFTQKNRKKKEKVAT